MSEYLMLMQKKKNRRTIWLLIVLLLWCFGLVGLFKEKSLQINKNNKDYWASTGIEFKDAVEFINNKKCSHTLKSALACINGIDSVARLSSLTIVVSTPKPDLIPVNIFEKKSDKSTQLKWLLDLKKKFKKIDYTKLLEDIYLKALKDPTNSEALLAGTAINGFLSISKDPHSYIIPITQFNDTLGNSEREEVSIGVVLRKVRNEVYISRVISRSSAERLGLRRGDKLISINGKTVNANNLDQIKLLLKGGLNTSVLLSLVRNNELFNYQVPRESLVIQSAEAQVIRNAKYSFGVLSLSKFATGSCKEMRNQIINLIDLKVSGIILDLRDNGGGQLVEAGCVANLFLDKNKIVYQTKYLDGHLGETFITRDNAIYKGPVSILVNANTASAAEILAGALKDHGRGLVVGEKTFGKGSFQAGKVWEKNSSLALFETQGLYYLPSGKSAQLVGIKPDIETQSSVPQNNREEDLFFNAIPFDLLKQASINSKSIKLDSLFYQNMVRNCRSTFDSDLGLEEKISNDLQLKGAWLATACLTELKIGNYY